jgi:signal transduction histidine kinase
MNVARADWKPLTDDELALLHTIGILLGFAVERDRLIRSRTEEAIRGERERVGRELHDSVMQGLTATSLQLEVADAVVEQDPSMARERIRTALRLTQETLAEARGTVDNLAPLALQAQPVWDAIAAMCERFAGINGMEVVSDVPAMRARPDLAIERGLYRIVSEGLNNVVKHAGATRVTVSLRQKGDRATLILEDNGRGFDRMTHSGASHGYGLHSMRRRTKMMGGRFRLVTAPGKGTRVEVNVPIAAGGGDD